MNLREQINQDVKNAMKAKDTKKRDALRLLVSAFKQIEVDERKELSDDDVIKIIQKLRKNRFQIIFTLNVKSVKKQFIAKI